MIEAVVKQAGQTHENEIKAQAKANEFAARALCLLELSAFDGRGAACFYVVASPQYLTMLSL